jgi:hypothetical protein
MGISFLETRVAGGTMRKLISLPVLLFVIAAVSSAQAQHPDIFVTPIPVNPFTVQNGP